MEFGGFMVGSALAVVELTNGAEVHTRAVGRAR